MIAIDEQQQSMQRGTHAEYQTFRIGQKNAKNYHLNHRFNLQ